MSFRAKHQPVWVEVVDANGEIRLRRNVGAGEKVECGGVLPLVVVIGRADSIEVEVRGKPFNFAPFARDNVARFEVK
jgi:cytoskeleton protein RodZ